LRPGVHFSPSTSIDTFLVRADEVIE